MKNQNGMVLIMTAGFMLIFTLLGLGAVMLAGSRGQEAAKKTASIQAFWLAESGIQRATAMLLKGTAGFSMEHSLGAGGYSATAVPLSSVRWRVNSTGSVASVFREITVLYGPRVMNTLQTTGTVDIGGHADVDDPIQEFASLSFAEIFGMSMDAMSGIAEYHYDASTFNKDSEVEGITFVDLKANEKININANFEGNGLLVVRSTDNTPGTVQIEGGDFNGVLWVDGILRMITGNPVINGAIFVDCGSEQTKIRGNADINMSEAEIDKVFAGDDLKLGMISWQELK